ncbi:unnamed protein product [Coffea canephora]|uniref:DH200=94 genomic scaffold, scaffold_485 n=1 Tax=Coffea canephora TaxID=49390 RepID=A0A068VFU9_COFCA|nr:unnamed protein product [Coffea canephora]
MRIFWCCASLTNWIGCFCNGIVAGILHLLLIHIPQAWGPWSWKIPLKKDKKLC